MKRVCFLAAVVAFDFAVFAANPTNTVPVARVAVIAETNGVLLAPANFFEANGITTSNLVDRVDSLEQRADGVDSAIDTITNQIAELQQAKMYRYAAGDGLEVFATASNVTASLSNSIYTLTIPAGTRILSARARLTGADTDGGKIYIDAGTNDMNNATTATMWLPVVSAFREDTLANVPVIALPDASEPGRIVIGGLGTSAGITYQIRMGF